MCVVLICETLQSGKCYLHIIVAELTAGCFKCGKEGHIARDCPDASSADTGMLANNDS